MKKALLAFSLFAVSAQAQPVITDGTNFPAVGYSTPVSIGASTQGAGGGGANQTWDFSSAVMNLWGTYAVVNPSSTALTASFPTATNAATLEMTAGGTLYFYYNMLPSKFEELASGIATATDEHNYTPNPKTQLKFPFAFGDTDTDTYQKVGFSPDDVTNTYDGYGTLITPFGTYNNAVRIKYDYSGSSIGYRWYSLNPLMQVFVYTESNQIFAFEGSPTSVQSAAANQASVHIYPNPIKDRATVNLNGVTGKSNFVLTNALGQTVREFDVQTSTIELSRNGLAAGMYSYRVQSENGLVVTGKLAIQ